MSRIMEELIKEERKENTKEIALKMINVKKLSLEEVADISGLQLNEVKALAEEAGIDNK